MKIRDVEVYLCEGPRERLRWIFLQLEIDGRLVGLGDATNWPKTEMVVQAIEFLEPVMVGENPFDIERLWQRMYRALHPTGVARVAILALPGIETAPWGRLAISPSTVSWAAAPGIACASMPIAGSKTPISPPMPMAAQRLASLSGHAAFEGDDACNLN
ncbi:MAG: hypothetical protein ACLFV5_09190 [Anaerolineales bacterium]